jgi:SAM-dependent methyltransferase
VNQQPMFQPADDVELHQFERHVVLFHNRTGRNVILSAEGLADLRLEKDPQAPLVRRLAGLFMLDTPSATQLGGLVVCRSRLVLWRDNPLRLWCPAPAHRTHGGHGYLSLQLTERESEIWALINDSRTVRDIADALGEALDALLATLAQWTPFTRQLIQLRHRPPHPRDQGLSRLVSPPRPDNDRPDDQFGDDGDTDLLHYHLHDITDGSTHFDNRETTVAHALAVAHPALAGQPYGARLLDQLVAGQALPQRPLVLEIGCGDGELSRDWMTQAASHGYTPLYVRADLSPELLRTQEASSPGTFGVLADAISLPFREQSFDLILSNEVIADLKSAPYPNPSGSLELREAIESRVQRYGLQLEAETTLVNLGSWMMLEEIERLLKPGGVAWLSEFGDLEKAPEQAAQLDHPEVSIHFGQLLQVAQSLGFEAHCLPLGDFLHLDYQAAQLSRGSWEALRALARSQALHLPARAWTPESLHERLPETVNGLRWVPMWDEGPGPLISRFFVLRVRKPPKTKNAG